MCILRTQHLAHPFVPCALLLLPCPCFATEGIATRELWFAYCKGSNTYHNSLVAILSSCVLLTEGSTDHAKQGRNKQSKNAISKAISRAKANKAKYPCFALHVTVTLRTVTVTVTVTTNKLLASRAVREKRLPLCFAVLTAGSVG